MLFIGHIFVAIGTFLAYTSNDVEKNMTMPSKHNIWKNVALGIAWPVVLPTLLILKLLD